MRWEKGKSGNPAGRPKKGQTLTDILMAYLEEHEEGDDLPRKQRFVEACYRGAMDGDTTLAKYIWDRIDGQPVQRTELVNLPEVIEYGVPDENNADSENGDVTDGADSLPGS